MRYFLLVIFLFSIKFYFGQVFSNTDEKVSLESVFQLTEDKANFILSTSYLNQDRNKRIEIKDLILQGSYFTKNLNRSGQVIFAGEAVDYLNHLKSKILANYPIANSAIQVFITDDAALNAFATIDNRIYVNVGLLARIETEGQLVYILCHEIMHIINQHIIHRNVEILSESTTISKDDISKNKKGKVLSKHSDIQADEFESDMDGFSLFRKLNYDQVEALNAINLLATAEMPVIKSVDALTMLNLDDHTFNELKIKFFSDLQPKSLIKNNDGQSTHPSVKERWDALYNVIGDSVLKSFESQSDIFVRISAEAKRRIASIFAQDMDFLSLFQNASSRYYSGERNYDVLNGIGYSLQGMFNDKIKKFKNSPHYSLNLDDSLMTFFYNVSSLSEFACWTYHTFLRMNNGDTTGTIKEYFNKFISNFQKLDPKLASEILQGELKEIDQNKIKSEINFEEIDFRISADADLNNKQNRYFNKMKGIGNYDQGKIALLSSQAFYSRRKKVSKKSNRQFYIDQRKSEELEIRSYKSMIHLSENRNDLISIEPNFIKYNSVDYELYCLLTKWSNEFFVFNDSEYRSYYEKEIDSLINKSDIRYIFSNLMFEIRTGSQKQMALTYFSPFITPLYVPMLIVNTIIDGSRFFNLTIIIDLKNKSLVFWDKRTSNNPSTSAIIYQNYDEILNEFMKINK